MKRIAVDFLRERGTPVPGRWLLAIGVLCLTVAAGIAHQWELERSRQETLWERQANAHRSQIEEATRPAPLSSDTLRLQRSRLRPGSSWVQVLRAVERATGDPVFLLNLAMDPVSGGVQLEAEAPTFGQALAYVRSLDTDGVLEASQLIVHESGVDATTGLPNVRFSVLARWRRQ